MRLATSVLLALVAMPALAAEPTLRVQARWKIVGVAVSTSASQGIGARAVARTLERSAATIARELPGIRWEVSPRVREAVYEDDAGRSPELMNPGFERLVERLAAGDDELAAADVVFVFAPCPSSDYSGMADLRAHPGGKAPLWYSVVNTEQGPHFAKKIRASLESLGPAGAVLERATDAVASLVDREPVRSLALRATTVHEFGHFLAPGTKDVRAAGNLEGRIGNGSDEPEQHELRCVMWTPEPRSLLAKLRAFPRLIRYCDHCRKRLGIR